MDTAILSATAGLVGSLIGEVSSFGASWLTQRRSLRNQALVQHAMQRQALHSEFIVEASKRIAEAWNHQAEGPEVIAGLYSAVGRMQLMSSNRVLQCAEGVMQRVIAAYADPNRTFDDFKARIHAGEQADPLKDFTRACREELGVLRD